MKVNIKGITKGKGKINTITIPCEESLSTVKELLTYMVRYCVREYNSRKENGELLKVLGKEEISNKSATGKIGFGVNYGEKKPKPDEAIENALQCYEDGIVVLFVGDRKTETLEEEITVKDDTELTFIRLTMLAGRMW